MLYREIIAVCSQIHTKHINTPCGQNAVSPFGYNRQYEQVPRIHMDRRIRWYIPKPVAFLDSRTRYANNSLYLLSLFQALSCRLVIYALSGSWPAFPVSFSNNEASRGDSRIKNGLIMRDWKFSERWYWGARSQKLVCLTPEMEGTAVIRTQSVISPKRSESSELSKESHETVSYGIPCEQQVLVKCSLHT